MTLTDAINRRHVNDVRALIRSGVDVNAPLRLARHTRALHLAAELDAVDIVELLLDANAHIDAVDESAQTACIAAARADAADVVELLVRRGANLSLLDEFEYSALSVAVRTVHTSDRAVVALIAGGAPLDHETTLCLAAALSTRVLQMLLDRNINVRQLRDKSDATACHLACERAVEPHWDAPAVLDMLVNVAGVDLHATNDAGATCLHRCAWTGACRTLRWLINAGVDVDAVDYDYMTPLHRACEDRQYEAALYLIAAGADVHAQTDAGNTACHFAADPVIYIIGEDQVVADAKLVCLLVAGGSDFEGALDLNGESARQLAAARNIRAPTAEENSAMRRSIDAARLEFVCVRALQVCIGLQSLGLDALQTCEILLHACGPVAPLIPFHHWWTIATSAKHFVRRTA